MNGFGSIHRLTKGAQERVNCFEAGRLSVNEDVIVGQNQQRKLVVVGLILNELAPLLLGF